jgi:HD-like signal output (HDOD) protein
VNNFTTLRMMHRLEETLELPPLPETASRIIELRVDPYADARQLSTVVETDPSLAAQIVSWASSSYYGYSGKVNSVQDAIVRVLGFDLVSNLALGLALGKSLNLPKDAPQGFTRYWQQAVYGATAMESARSTGRPSASPTSPACCTTSVTSCWRKFSRRTSPATVVSRRPTARSVMRRSSATCSVSRAISWRAG